MSRVGDSIFSLKTFLVTYFVADTHMQFSMQYLWLLQDSLQRAQCTRLGFSASKIRSGLTGATGNAHIAGQAPSHEGQEDFPPLVRVQLPEYIMLRDQLYQKKRSYIQWHFNGSNTDGSFTSAVSNSLLSPFEKSYNCRFRII